jgi:hypothetical protein
MAIRDSEILGLFTTPADIQRLQQEQIASQAQTYTDPIARQLYTGLSQVGQSIPGMLGAQAPEMAQAKKIEQIRKSVPFDVNNQSEYYTKLAQQLINNGLTAAGAQALEAAKQARLDEARIRNQEAKKAGDLSVTAEKAINQANADYSDAFENASKAAELAARFREKASGLSGGLSAVLMENWKDIIGNQDDVTLLRKQYAQLRNNIGLKSLPPGAASDADVAIAFRPYPDETADPTYVASFLDGLAKQNMIAAEFNKFKASYLSKNRGDAGNLIPAWEEYYLALDLPSLFAQQGLTFRPAEGTTAQPAPDANVIDFGALQ